MLHILGDGSLPNFNKVKNMQVLLSTHCAMVVFSNLDFLGP